MAGANQVLVVDTDIESKAANGRVQLVTEDGVQKFQAAQVHLHGDIWIYATAGAPVDYTDGDPAATGEGEAGIGSLCVRLDTGKWYTNGGTKAEPIWKLITSAA